MKTISNEPNRKVVPFNKSSHDKHWPSSSKKIKLKQWLPLFLIILFIGYSFFSLKQAFQRHELKQNELAQAQERYQEIQLQHDQVKEDYARSKDEDYIANVARRDYYFSKEDEIIFDIEKADIQE